MGTTNSTRKKKANKELISVRMPHLNPESQTKNQEKKHQNDSEKMIAKYTKILALTTIVLAVIGIATAVIFYLQFQEMKEDSRTNQRAWVMPIGNNGQRFDKNIFNVFFKNTGKTPALNIISSVGYTNALDHIKETDVFPKNTSIGAILAPNDVETAFTYPVPSSEIISIQKGMPFYVYGTIWYKDIYGKSHWTQFCWQVSTDLKTFGIAEKHNRTDDF